MANIAIVPARSGSKGVKNKNILPLGNNPLFVHSINTAIGCDKIDRCIFTTDSEEYIEINSNISPKVQSIKRPRYISSDNSTDYNYLIHAINVCDMDYGDNIILLRPTTPLRKLDVINNAIEKWITPPNGYSSLRSYHEINESPEKMFKREYCGFGIVPYMTNINNEQADLPRQHYDAALIPNGYIDIIRVSTIINTKTVYGNNIMGFNSGKTVEIDSYADVQYLEYLIEKGKR